MFKINQRTLIPVFVAILVCSCAKPTGGGRHATILMRDGVSVSGTILSSSGSELQISGDDQVTRTIPMTQVRSVDYDDPVSDVPASTATSMGAPSPAVSERPHWDHYHPVETAITTKSYDLPVGTEISVRNEETIDSGKAVEGQTFPAEVTRDVRDADGDVVIPRGSNAEIVLLSVSKGGRIRGASDLVLDLKSISIDGRRYEISTTNLSERGRNGVGRNRRTGEFTGGGAAIGAIIGAIAGGGKGAALGAGSGAGAGALTQILTKGKVKVPVESILIFKLDRQLKVIAAP